MNENKNLLVCLVSTKLSEFDYEKLAFLSRKLGRSKTALTRLGVRKVLSEYQEVLGEFEENLYPK